jgi:hypothetical protein
LDEENNEEVICLKDLRSVINEIGKDKVFDTLLKIED